MAEVKDYSAEALLAKEKEVELDTDDVKEESVQLEEKPKQKEEPNLNLGEVDFLIISIGRFSGGTAIWGIVFFPFIFWLYSSTRDKYSSSHSFFVTQLRLNFTAFSFPCLARNDKYSWE